jgi:4'-phosphopantetheinyl transferase
MDAEIWHPADHAPPLGPEDVHVWRVSLDCDEHTTARLGAFIAADERQRGDRFHFAHDRRRYVTGRGWLRVLLGEYLAVRPHDVPLSATALGKPVVVGESALRFNVAHSADLALVGVTRGRDIGVDVEFQRADVDGPSLAGRFFAPEEVAALKAFPPAEQRTTFYRCWTRKEAYVKALGLGMQVPLDGFAVTLASNTAALTHTSHDPSQLARWQLRGLSPAPGFAAAVAVEGTGWRLFCGHRATIP